MATDRERQLLLDAAKAGITSPKELANFMGQVSQESGGLRHLNESFIYTKGLDQIPVASATKDPVIGESARIEALNGHPEKLAELMYGGGKMGNNQAGDGYKYRGRGYIQLTGKDNYEAVGKAVGLDLVNDPDLAAEPANASKIAVNFWSQNIHEIAPENVDKATHLINKAGLGLENRRNYAAQWEKVLTSEVMAGLAKGMVALPGGPFSIASTNGRSEPSHKVAGPLRQGAHGDAVNALQTDLGALGYTDAGGKTLQADKEFGPATNAAVRAFQRDNHLLVDGVAGFNTVNAIHDLRRAQAHEFLAPKLPNLVPSFDGAFDSEMAATKTLEIGGRQNKNQIDAVFRSMLPTDESLAIADQGPGLDDPRNGLNPNNALYNELQQRIPDASEDRLLQFTAACHANKITAENLSTIHLDEPNMKLGFQGTGFLSTPAVVDLNTPPRQPIFAAQQIPQHDQLHAAAVAGQIQAQNTQANPQLSSQSTAQVSSR